MKITFTGDISLYNIDAENFKYNDLCLQVLNSSDLLIGNLECPITDIKTNGKESPYPMSASNSALSIVDFFDVFSLANNHIRDYASRGLQDTISELNKRNIRYFGAGITYSRALKPLIIRKDKLKIAFIGVSRFANISLHNGGGTVRDGDARLYNLIKELKEESHFVIIYFHWGYEYVRIPSPRERRIAHKCIDIGADLIIGSHPHIYQGIENYKDKIIVYSLGNFIFHSSVFNELAPIPDDPSLKESFIFSIDVKDDYSYNYSINGYRTTDNSVECYNTIKNQTLVNDICKISKIFNESYYHYLKAYYKQTYDISIQNQKIRNNLKNYKELSMLEKVSIYKNANFQDMKNRISGVLIKIFKYYI